MIGCKGCKCKLKSEPLYISNRGDFVTKVGFIWEIGWCSGIFQPICKQKIDPAPPGIREVQGLSIILQKTLICPFRKLRWYLRLSSYKGCYRAKSNILPKFLSWSLIISHFPIFLLPFSKSHLLSFCSLFSYKRHLSMIDYRRISEKWRAISQKIPRKDWNWFLLFAHDFLIIFLFFSFLAAHFLKCCDNENKRSHWISMGNGKRLAKLLLAPILSRKWVLSRKWRDCNEQI